MTVAELIRELTKHDMNARVVVNLGKNDLANGTEVRGLADEYCMKSAGSFCWEYDDPEYDGLASRAEVVNIYGGLS